MSKLGLRITMLTRPIRSDAKRRLGLLQRLLRRALGDDDLIQDFALLGLKPPPPHRRRLHKQRDDDESNTESDDTRGSGGA